MGKILFFDFLNSKKKICKECGITENVKKTNHGYYCDNCYMIKFVQPEVDKIDRNVQHQINLNKKHSK